MPIKRLDYTLDYCKANPIGFAIITILLFEISIFIPLFGFDHHNFHIWIWNGNYKGHHKGWKEIA